MFLKPNISMVTAFFDIGRGSWQGFTNGHPLPHYLKRTTEEYFERFEHLLKLDNDIVVFTSKDLISKVRELGRKYFKTNLFIVEANLQELYPEYREKVRCIQEDSKFQQGILSPWNPQYWSVDFIMVNFLKSHFVNEAIK